jgi:hypothetical protein
LRKVKIAIDLSYRTALNRALQISAIRRAVKEL